MIDIANKRDEYEYYKYMTIRGKGTYKIVDEMLMILTNRAQISYSEFSGFIRYDKRLRDLLYVYLGSFEEYLKSICFEKIEYEGQKDIYSVNDNNLNLFRPSDEYGYNLYKHSKMDLGNLLRLIRKFYETLELDLIDKDYFAKLIKVRKLRNLVMHHSLVLVDPLTCDSELKIRNHFSVVTSWLVALRDLLPNDWKKGYVSDLDRIKYEKDGKLLTNIFLEISI
jgi:hypothetical protein